MEKIIELDMKENRNIDILVSSKLKKTILEGDRRLSAQDIYDIIDYKIGDHLAVETKNEKGLDQDVLSFFSKMLDDICKSINSMDFSQNDPATLESASVAEVQ